LRGYIQHPEIKSLGPDGEKCKAHTRGLLRRITINGGLQYCIGKEVSRFEQGKDDFIENIDDVCIHYNGGRVAANESLIVEINVRGLRKTTWDRACSQIDSGNSKRKEGESLNACEGGERVATRIGWFPLPGVLAANSVAQRECASQPPSSSVALQRQPPFHGPCTCGRTSHRRRNKV
jgi:hypothetical protein